MDRQPDATGLRGRSLLKETDLSPGEFLYMVELGSRLRAEKRRGVAPRRLAGRNIADLREDLDADPLGVRGRRAR